MTKSGQERRRGQAKIGVDSQDDKRVEEGGRYAKSRTEKHNKLAKISGGVGGLAQEIFKCQADRD